MEGLTRLVSESLARYGLDRPVDYRRLQWSRWFRCESLHSLLHVPSKSGIFAVAEEIMEFGSSKTNVETAAIGGTHVGTAAQACPEQSRRGCPDERSSAAAAASELLGGAALQRCDTPRVTDAALAAEGRRMLSVLQFHEDDDMAYVLDRMLSRHNPLSARLASGRCFVRFVVIDDAIQRRSICNALNQWLVSTSETVTGIGAHFATSLEFNVSQARVARTPSSATVGSTAQPNQAQTSEVEVKEVEVKKDVKKEDARQTAPLGPSAHLDSGFATNIHCPQPLPSGF